ncbi:MAG: hypothetical protein PVJ92_02860 [Candidatus Dependentiae bacterium]|jgi:hypothetical protein
MLLPPVTTPRYIRRRGFTVLEFLLYAFGLLILVQGVCMTARLTKDVAAQLPSYVDLVRFHLPAVRQFYAEAERHDITYLLKEGRLYRTPPGGRRVCLARGVKSVNVLPGKSVVYTTTDGWHIEEGAHATR